VRQEGLWQNHRVESIGPAQLPEMSSTTDRGALSWFPVAAAALFGLVIAGIAGTHIVALGIIVPLVIGIAWTQPRTLLLFLAVWLIELGLIRRVVASGGSVGLSGDPLLIVGPLIILCLLLVMSSGRGAYKGRSTMASAVLGLNILALVEVINPGQGTIMVGLGGLLFMLIPVCAFWIGRGLLDEDLARQLVWVVAIVGAMSAAYGLFQTFGGFPSWDKNWLQTKAYRALVVHGQAVRAFGTMSSSQDYAAFMSVTMLAWVALLVDKVRRVPRWFNIAMIILTGAALFYSSVRTAAALAIIALSVVFCAIRRLSLSMAVVAAPMLVLVAFFGLQLIGNGSTASDTGVEKSSTQVLANHQLSGLTNPTGSNSSLNGHVTATIKGMSKAFSKPIGNGVGAVTLAAGRFNNGKAFNNNTEFDPGNMSVAFGILGLGGYLAVLFLGLSRTYRMATARRDAISVFCLGVVMVMLLEWFNGDLYASSWLVWLCLGFVDGNEMRLEEAADDMARVSTPLVTSRRRWSTS